MGLMDKFKNLFTDEEFDDEEFDEPVKIKEVKKVDKKTEKKVDKKEEKDKLPTFMRKKIEKDEHDSEKEEVDVPDFKISKGLLDTKEFADIEQPKVEVVPEIDKKDDGDEKFKFPFDFDDSDFSDISRVSRQSRTSKKSSHVDEHHAVVDNKKNKLESKKEVKVAELYKDKKDNKKVDLKKFRATPIISPIYGVLDKNYRKEELDPVNGDNYEINRPSKNIDFDSVRKKAYGNKKKDTLVDDIKNNMMCENCDYFKKAKFCGKGTEEDDLLYEALCEKNTVDKDITLDEATENYYDYGVEYEKKTDIDSYDDLEDVKIVNHDTDDLEDVGNNDIEKKHAKKKKDIPPVKSSINLLSTLKKSMGEDGEEVEEKNLELTGDLFNLIDSMYDEGKE